MTLAPVRNDHRIRFRGLATALLAAASFLVGATTLQDAVANGDTRTLSFYHTHTRESITVTFKRDGRYDSAALAQLNRFLRDWRNDDVIKMDPRLFDLAWEVYREARGSAPIQIVSAYRSPKTNAMLRSRSRGVAKHSQHTLGKAMDFRIPGVEASRVREIGLRLQRGGVGYYPSASSYFIHLDTGSVRHWPRMTRTQLARVFPDGRTVHLPADGKPMPGYQMALADLQRGGGAASGGRAVAGGSSGGSGGGFFARLFNADEAEDEGETAAAKVRTAQVRAVETQAAAPVPAPAAPQPVQTASAPALPEPRPVAYADADRVQLAALSGGPRMVWQTGPATSDTTPGVAPVTATLAPALPSPRPQATALAAAPAPVVPLPTHRPVAATMVAALAPVPLALERTASAAPRPALRAEPKSELVTVKLDAGAIRSALVPERIARGHENARLAHPDQSALAQLMAQPSRTLAQSFGGNPTGGLRSDAFQGRAVALIRSVPVDQLRTTSTATRRNG